MTILKMNGAKNEFLVLDERRPRLSAYGAFARRWCDRSGGIGADGLLVVLPPTAGGAATMRVFNADGTEAEACGNGVRCVARYLWEQGAGERFAIDCNGESIAVELQQRKHQIVVRADLGVPVMIHRLGDGVRLEACGDSWHYGHVTMPNPHVVMFVDDPARVDLEALGAALTHDPAFPLGTNAHVARVHDRNSIVMRHYERGVGVTQACGTGAVAAAVLALDDRRVENPVRVIVPGGELEVVWETNGHAILSGPAETEFVRSVEVE
ncbi:MAG: diaminopimelate epimerase [Candidatus Eremiobacteraeota bacterium]|nr:diaminopimelate epimerase [Candidatus Eremiobacteraeota bacterium]